MRTKYLLCLGRSPDDLGDEEYDEDTLEGCQGFANLNAARKEFDRFVNGATNMRVHLLEVKMIESARGRIK